LRLCVIGGGAVGLTLATHARLGGCSIVVLSRRGGPAEFRGSWLQASFKVLEPPWPPLDCEYSLLCVKAYDTVEALEWMKTYRVSAPVLLVVQNGMGGLEEAERIHGGIVAAGVSDFGAEKRGSLALHKGMGRLVMGCRGWDCSWALEPLSRCLSEGGLEVIVASDIEPYRWLKLAVNAAINGVTALLGAPNGVIVEDPNARKAALLVAEAVEEEALRRGIKLPRPAAEEVLRVASMTAGNRSSTLQDLERASRTEVDYILGPLSDSNPALNLLYNLVKALENLRLKQASRKALTSLQ
jgi:2-dehydropantoate 2-reductase